jgi:hypothetical protein
LKKTLQTLRDQGFWPGKGLEVESPMASKRLLYEIALQGIEENLAIFELFFNTKSRMQK